MAVDHEEQILELANMVKTMAPLVKQAHDLKSLWTTDGFTTLSDLFLDQLTTIPGAYMHFLNNGFAAVADAFAAPDRERMAQAQAQQQYEQQTQGGSFPIAAVAQAMNQQPQQNYWADGQAPLDRNDLRPAFPGIPNPAPGQQLPQVDLEGVHPSQLYSLIDDLSARGALRGTTFVSE